jgi:4-diphosphocytidyl-2-C-methyl-D-erythritol kinase
MRVRAFAKINLSLEVVGRRRDGFHELRTIFQSIALHDTLTIRRARGRFRLACDDPSCPTDETNLIWRAAMRVWKAAGRRGGPRDVSVDLRKRIPVQGGLGGGSSDCAAAIRAFARLWRVDDERARRIGHELGADVPYFFEGGTVLGLERGDLLFPLLDRPRAWIVLVLPEFGVTTAEAFGWWDADVRRYGARVAHAGGLVNDLEATVARRHPEIARLIRDVRNVGAQHAAMSGSGSTVFGVFDAERAAMRAARVLASRSHRAHVTTTMSRARYQRLAAPRLRLSKPIG